MATEPPTYEQITLTRHLGHPLTVDIAPRHSKISLGLLMAQPYVEYRYPDLLVIADQVVYRITGWDPAGGTLTVELVEDHRPTAKEG